MNADASGGPEPAGEQQQAAQPGRPGEPSEQELRAAYEAELSRISTTDMIAQAAVSLLNLGARRLAPAPAPGAGAQAAEAGRDLEQARDAIDAVRALLAILERTIAQELGPLRDALSQLQMAYTREIQAQPAPAGDAAAPAQSMPAEATQQPDTGERGSAPGPAQASGRLWVPGS